MLEIKKLSSGYPGNRVLQEISLTIPEGKVTVIAGPNGCGKSTLLKALAGILPAEGNVILDGNVLDPKDTRKRAQTIAFLPQNRSVPEITVERLVLHGRFPYLRYPRQYRKQDHAIAQRAMERMGIQDLAQRGVASLSGGQRQKVYIAMALAQDTPVVLLDEPNTFLDIGHQLQMMAHARALAEEGKTVVLVLHDLAMALEFADELVVLARGRVLCQGDGETVFASGCLEEAFGVAVKRTMTPEGWKYYYGGR